MDTSPYRQESNLAFLYLVGISGVVSPAKREKNKKAKLGCLLPGNPTSTVLLLVAGGGRAPPDCPEGYEPWRLYWHSPHQIAVDESMSQGN